VSEREDKAAVGMTWNNGDALSICLANEDGAASDTVGARTSGVGRVACSAQAFACLLEALDTKRVHLSVQDTPGAVLRIERPADAGMVALLAPIYWRAPLGAGA
jgi:hypothetical protein